MKQRSLQPVAIIISIIIIIGAFVFYALHNNKSATDGKGDTSINTLPADVKVMLSGAGSSFAYPIYTKMIDEYRNRSGTETTYESIGSGAGIKKLVARNVDFGASDAFLSNDEMAMFPAPVVQFPTCLGAVVLTYNLPGNPELNLSPDVIADIFLGKVTKWNDKRIKEENKDAKLPDLDITVVHRSDGSGTSYIFTDYLSKISDEWKSKVGSAKLPSWPIGQGGNGSEGVAQIIKFKPGTIGYVELVYALQKFMDVANVKNSSGKYIKPSLESTTVAGNIDIPADTRISITNSPVSDAYPICSFTWIMLYKEQSYNGRTKAQVTDMMKELWWMIHNDGQQYAKPLNYAPLPQNAMLAAENVLKSVTYNGEPVLQ